MRWLPAMLIAGIFLLSAALPTGLVERLPLCIFHHVTGWDCPGCGLTRAFIALFHGEFRQAIAYNALAVPLALFLPIYALAKLDLVPGGIIPTELSPAGSRWIGRLFLVLIFGQWALKTALHAWERF